MPLSTATFRLLEGYGLSETEATAVFSAHVKPNT